jgi:hypothetical protein
MSGAKLAKVRVPEMEPFEIEGRCMKWSVKIF